jgi:ParB-like chromosome segregation protein Spo0J
MYKKAGIMVFVIEIDQIVTGERRREDMGDLAGLARSIEKYGLLHAVVLDGENRLVAGGRRLAACRDILRRKEIEARSLGDLSEEERREIELEENLQRKDMTPHERRKQMIREARKIAPVISSKIEEKDPRGRRSHTEVPKKEIAQALGVSVGTLVHTEQAVETAELYPFMQNPQWKQSQILEAREHLAAMPGEHAEMAVDMIDGRLGPTAGLTILSGLRHMPERRRANVLKGYRNGDQHARKQALSEAVQNPCYPDPRSVRLIAVTRELELCVKVFPNDPLNPRYCQLLRDAQALAEDTRAANKARLASMLEGEGDEGSIQSQSVA